MTALDAGRLFGAHVLDEDHACFRLWAPSAQRIELELDGAPCSLEPDSAGWVEHVAPARPGTRYRYRINGDLWVPDPASRFQPEGVHGPSELVDTSRFSWTVEDWRGQSWREAVLYELHIGTFTAEGTYRAAIDRLDALVDLGVTAVELLPLAQAPGQRGWGYDGVLPFAPHAPYGRPEDLAAFVDACHARGLMVLLDVVYNHFGPEGNYLHAYARPLFSQRHHTPWGEAFDFDGPGAKGARRFFVENTLLEEYRFDGLRLDAVNQILDDSNRHILDEIAGTARWELSSERSIHLTLENDDNQAFRLERDAERPRSYTAQWNDDVHHPLQSLLTGQATGYYGDYQGDPVGWLARALTEGFGYQGERSAYRGNRPRGEASDHLCSTAFINFLQNHDQVGNRPLGERIHHLARAERVRAGAAIVILSPGIPMLFMGEEWAASSPFQFFCDLEPRLRRAVRDGRRREFSQFPEFEALSRGDRIPDPCASDTFERSKLDWSERSKPAHSEMLDWYRHLLDLRARHVVPKLIGVERGRVVDRWGSAVLLEWAWPSGATLSMFANLSDDDVPGWRPSREIFFSTHPEHDWPRSAPAWSVACFEGSAR